MKKRILAWIMALMIVLGTMPMNVLQASANTNVKSLDKTHANQISEYLLADISTGEFSKDKIVEGSTQKTYGKNGEIKVNKVIRPYDIDADGKDDANEENLFQIDLEVETSSTIKEEDLATVIVIDISNSMDVAYGNGKTRMEAAEEAANEFIESFGQTTLSSTQREVSVVMFCKTATIASDWVDVTDNNKRAALKNSVNNLSNNMSNGTSIEGGLLLARNLLTTQSIENKNVVLLSDGGANTCVVDKSEEESYKKYYNGPSNELITYYTNEPDNAPGNEGKIINSYTGVYNNANYHFHHGGAIEAAKRIRELDADIYSIYCGDPAELMTCHDPNAKDKLDVSECDYCEAARNAFNGEGEDYTVERWLSITDPDNTERVSDNYTLVNNSSELMSAFLKIESTLTSAWVVADPIPIADQLEFVEFKSEYDKAARVYESGSVLWDLTKATPEESVIEKDNSQTTILKYKLSYYVRLDNLCEGFAEQNVYNTNNITSLPYSITNEDGDVTASGKAYFNIPAVKGYVSNETISFIKKGQVEVGSDETILLENATFEITHSSYCTCGTTLDDPNWSLKATSDDKGSFSFSKIPSGHRYEMKETRAPDGYKASTGVYDFSVIYGEIIVNNNNLFDNNNTVVNEKVNTISGEKSWKGGPSNNRPIVTINLYANGVPAVDEKGNVITASVSSETNWKYEFADLPKKDENGNDIEYTVIESPIDNYYPEYTPTEEGFNIENIYSSNKSISGTKVWDDENNRYGTRPENITIELTAYKERNGEVTPYEEGSRTQTIDANNGWRYYFKDLPTREWIDGERYTISYELSEVSVDGYNTTISNDETIITNTLNTPVTKIIDDKITVTKVDSASNNIKLPETEFTIYKDEQCKESTGKTYKSGNDGTIVIKTEELREYLPTVENENGTTKLYLKETEAPEGYIASDKVFTIEITSSLNTEINNNNTYIMATEYAITIDGKESIDVENTKKVITPISAEISGTKTLTGRDWTEDDKFDFGLYETEENFSIGDDAEPVKTATVTKSNKTFSFDNLTYDKEGTYYYVIKELVPDAAKDTYKLNGIKYANTEYKVKVTVTDNLKGSLEAEVEYVDGDIEFTNTYEAEPVKVSLDAKKLVEKNGNAFEWGEEDFQFQVAEVGKELSTANIVSNDANGDINILDKTYDRSGTYQYVVSEYVTEDNMIGGVGYDVAEYTITVEVTDPGNGQLTKTVTVTNKDGGSVYPDDITFTNEYNPKVAKAVIKGTKILEGKEIESGEFTFELRNAEGDVIQEVNNEVGEFVFNGYEFDELAFEHAGTYTFTIKEKDLNKDEYICDESVVTATVTVTDVDGVLEAAVQYSEDLEYENTYDPVDTSVTLGGSKVLTGRDINNEEFTFELKDKDKKVIQTVKNEGGEFEFDAITYDDIDGAETKDFIYYITEQSGDVGGVTYDEAEYRVTVTVTDTDHKGQLEIKNVKYEVKNEDGIYVKANGATFTNIYEPASTDASISGTKTLIGRDMKDGETFTFKLMKGEEEIDSATVTRAKAGETVSFELDTETFTEADEYNYTVVEVKGSEEGVEYDSTVYDVKVTVTDDLKGSLVAQVDYLDGTPAFTNEYTIDVSGSKAWKDNTDYNNRPDSITVNLLADGKKVAGQSVTAENDWIYTFDKLKVFNEEGKKIVYTVTEDAVNGYDTVITGSAADGFVITNTEKLTEVSGVKIWEDNNNQDGKRPESITVNLIGTIEGEENPVVAKSQIVSGEDWTWTFDDLPEYVDGKKVEYSVIEDTVKGYESSVDDKGDGKFEITNSYTPEKTSISGEKIWNDKNNQDGKRSESITVYLLKNGEKVDAKVVTADDNWEYAFEGLDKYENHGTLINYTVVEEAVKDYTTTYDGNDIINSYTPEETGVTVTKIWDDANNQDGIRTDSVTVNLIANGEETDKSVVLSEENNWTATFTGLDKKSDGEDIVYAVEEEAVSGYEEPIITKVTEGSNNFTITNKYVPEVVDFTIYKTWKDKHDKYDKRPAEITVYLKADGEVVRTVKLNKAGDWTYDFTNLPKYKDGIEIVYSVDEEEVEGYISEIDGFNIINSINEDALDIATDTGDDSNPWIYGFTSFLALCTAVGTFFVRRRKD